LVLLRRSAGLLPLRGTVQHRLADGSGELRGGVLPKPHRLGSNNNSPAVALGCAVEASRGGWRGCGRGSRCARWCARSARCPISPSTFLSISNCSTASATARRKSPSPASSSRSDSTLSDHGHGNKSVPRIWLQCPEQALVVLLSPAEQHIALDVVPPRDNRDRRSRRKTLSDQLNFEPQPIPAPGLILYIRRKFVRITRRRVRCI